MDEDKVYTISTGWKIFHGLGAICIAGFSLWILMKTATEKGAAPGIVLSLLFFTGAVLLMLYTVRRRVILSNTSIAVRGMFMTKQLLNADIKGFRFGDKAIFIEPTNPSLSRLRINDYISIGNQGEFIKSLSDRYANLDVISYQNNLAKVYNDTELGPTTEDRILNFKRYKQFAFTYNFGGILLFVISLIFSDFMFKNDLPKIVIVLYPLLGLLLLIVCKGQVKVITGKNSAYSGIVAGLYTSGIAGAILFITYYNFIAYSNIWPSLLVIAVFILAVLWRFGYEKGVSGVKGQIIFMGLMAIGYACPLTMLINCKLDASTPSVYNSAVVDRYIMHNNGRSYYHIKISPWGDVTPSIPDIHIDDELYAELEHEDHVHVNVKKGVLGIPWFYLSK